jgi:hypothetical protein
MGETSNIAKMAEKLSDELFDEFFWQKVGPTNWSWPCEDMEHHNNQSHPADVVFHYDEPYSQSRTYVHCDLKSYAKNSITGTAVRNAIISLAKQVSCAEKSSEWRDKYVQSDVNPEICGLLFIYNHDGEYDQAFANYIVNVKSEDIDIPRGSKIVVLGPNDIHWLDNVRYEICHMRGSSKGVILPEKKYCKFFYPQLERKPNLKVSKAKAATLEMLTSPWIILEYEQSEDPQRRGIIIFYRQRGQTEDEFIYLINYLRHYQVINSKTDILIKTLNAVDSAPSMFQKGVSRYAEYLGNTELAKLVRSIKCSSITQVKTAFSQIELGMDYV